MSSKMCVGIHHESQKKQLCKGPVIGSNVVHLNLDRDRDTSVAGLQKTQEVAGGAARGGAG